MNSILPIGGLILSLALPAWAQTQTSAGIEVLADALPTTALTDEAARNYNVYPSAGRGLLTLTVARDGKSGGVPAQVYAGAINQSGYPMSIPMRTVRDGESVMYLGEFRYHAPAALRFLVNVNVQGKQVSTEFNRSFTE